jgi:hypothetical protein
MYEKGGIGRLKLPDVAEGILPDAVVRQANEMEVALNRGSCSYECNEEERANHGVDIAEFQSWFQGIVHRIITTCWSSGYLY